MIAGLLSLPCWPAITSISVSELVRKERTSSLTLIGMKGGIMECTSREYYRQALSETSDEAGYVMSSWICVAPTPRLQRLFPSAVMAGLAVSNINATLDTAGDKLLRLKVFNKSDDCPCPSMMKGTCPDCPYRR